MAQTLSRHSPSNSILHKIEEHESVYGRLAAGIPISDDELMHVPSLQEITLDNAAHPLRGFPASFSHIYEHDRVIGMAVLDALMKKAMQTYTEQEITEAYLHAEEAMLRFRISPADYLAHFDAQEDKESAREAIQKGAVASAKSQLAQFYRGHSLFPGDDAVIKDRSAPNDERFDALMRPLPDELFLKVTTRLEQAFKGEEMEVYDFIDDVLPETVYACLPRKDTALPSAADMNFRRHLQDRLTAMAQAKNPDERAAAYREVLDVMEEHRGTYKKFVAMQFSPLCEPALKAQFQAGALAYVNNQLLDNFVKAKGMPSEEDRVVIEDTHAAPLDRLNALFRKTGHVGIRLLGVLEDVGFELDEPELVDKLLEAGRDRDRQGQGPAPA